MPTVNFIETTPPKNLAKYVEVFWHCQITGKGVLRLLPTASCDLMVHSSGKGMKAVLIGPMVTAQTTSLKPGTLFVGARFRPGCRIILSEKPFASLRDSKVSDFSIQLIQLAHFEKSIQDASLETIRSKLPLLLATLIKDEVVTRDSIVDKFLDEVEAARDNPTVASMLESLPISARQFQRRFRQYTCLSPKEFLRLYRHQHATEDMKRSCMTITKIASLHGYADHAHFSHDFQELAGIPPVALEKELTLK